MKKFLALLLAAIMCLSAFAAIAEETPAEEPAQEEPTEEEPAEEQNAEEEPAEEPAEEPEKAPELILGKFKSQDDLINAYKNLEKKIAELKAKGIIRRVGPDRGGHWEIVE